MSARKRAAANALTLLLWPSLLSPAIAAPGDPFSEGWPYDRGWSGRAVFTETGAGGQNVGGGAHPARTYDWTLRVEVEFAGSIGAIQGRVTSVDWRAEGTISGGTPPCSSSYTEETRGFSEAHAALTANALTFEPPFTFEYILAATATIDRVIEQTGDCGAADGSPLYVSIDGSATSQLGDLANRSGTGDCAGVSATVPWCRSTDPDRLIGTLQSRFEYLDTLSDNHGTVTVSADWQLVAGALEEGADSDGDGYGDDVEGHYRTDPNEAASYPVTPPGYWDGRDQVTDDAEPACGPLDSGIDPCDLEAGDVLVWRYSKSLNSTTEGFLGDTYFTHALIVVGFFDLGGDVSLDLVIADVTPNRERGELQLTTFHEMGQQGPDAMYVYRPAGIARPKREAAGRSALQTAWDHGAADLRNRSSSAWYAPLASYSESPTAWGPDAYYCSSLIAAAYSWDHGDFDHRIRLLEAPLGILGDALYVTPDDLVENLPGMIPIAGYGDDGRGFSLWSPAHFLLADPQGRRAGVAPDGSVVEEIPNSIVRVNENNESVTAPNVGDDWTLTVTGTGDGTYHLLGHGAGGLVLPLTGIARVVAPGQVATYTVAEVLFGAGPVETLDPTPGMDPGPEASGSSSLVAVIAVAVGLVIALGALWLVRRRAASGDRIGPPSD